MSLKSIIGGVLIASTLSVGVGAAVVTSQNDRAIKAEAAVSKTVTRVYIEDQVTTTPVLAIESISFASGYDHTAWRAFLTSYLGTRSSYTTTSGSSMPSSKGWSYMSDSEQQKYLLCPTGSKNFTMIFPEWVTAFSYKAVGNNWWNWFDVNGSAVGLHSGWGIGKKVNSYIYNDGGWKMNANLDNTAQTNTWGDITITARAIKSGTTTELANKSITMSKYYKIKDQTYNDIFGYTFGGWYTTNALSTEHNTLLTANETIYAKETAKTEAYVSGTMNEWNASDPTYLMEPGSDSQYHISVTFAKDTEFKIVYQKSNWYGWSQVDQSSSVVTNSSIVQGSDPDSTGYRIKAAVAGTYEIYLKTTAGSNKLWIQQDSETEATVFATAFLSSITCTDNSTTFNINVWNNVSGTASMEYKFSQLTIGAQGLLKTAQAKQDGTIIQQCVARYDRILGKYGYGTASGQYHDFMQRTPSPLFSTNVQPSLNSNNCFATVFIVISSVVTLVAVGGFFLIKKKKA